MDLLIVALSALAAGVANALAGGGTLITFPTLTAVGIPALTANVTNTFALTPGFFGGMLAQWKDLRGQQRRLWSILPASTFGSLLGGIILLKTGERLFTEIVPYLILMAAALLALQEPTRAWLARRAADGHGSRMEGWAWLPVGLAAIYGGYFGAGMSVIVLAILALMIDDSLTRLNALKQTIALSVSLAAAAIFLFSGRIVWPVALVIACAALTGGHLGGRLAGRVKPATLRWIVVSIGVVVGCLYLLR
jgi:uncharacterized membrane protein YfcA